MRCRLLTSNGRSGAGAIAQPVEPLLISGGDVVEPVVSLREDLRQPNHADLIQAETHPVAMGGNMLIQQGLEPHSLRLGP